jgi:ketosteroid isomerase-like protein
MIKAWSQGMLGQFRTTFDLDVDEVKLLDSWAFERGRYSIKMEPVAGGPAIEDTGKYITIYEKIADGTWRMARDIWNSSRSLAVSDGKS